MDAGLLLGADLLVQEENQGQAPQLHQGQSPAQLHQDALELPQAPPGQAPELQPVAFALARRVPGPWDWVVCLQACEISRGLAWAQHPSAWASNQL